MQVLQRSGRLLVLTLFAVTSLLMLFGPEVFAVIAPRGYGSGYEVMLVLAWANLAYSFNLIANTALIQARRPSTAVVVTTVGAILSVSLSWWLIPVLELRGAALASAASFFVMTLFGQWIAREAAGYSHVRPMLLALLAAALVGWLAQWISVQQLGEASQLGLKLIPTAIILAALWWLGGKNMRGMLWNR
jgi:O-antigen/teichoic acid export membrane protein